MENKKGSLSTVCLVIAIILIVVMGALLYMQKTEADRQIAELENNANKLQEIINDLQGKIDSISNTTNKNSTSNSDKEEKTIKPSKKISKLFKNKIEAEEYCLNVGEDSQIEEFYENEVIIADAIWNGLKANYQASSTHKKDTADYNVANLDNFYIDNCWCEGVSGNGIGEKIKVNAFASSEHVNNYAGFKYKREEATIEEVEEYLLSEYNKQHEESNKHGGNFPEITKENISNFYNEVTQIAIINGNAKSDELWKNNGRVKKLKLTIDNKVEYILEIDDSKELQIFDINYKNDSIIQEINMEFEIMEVYSGEKYEDVCLTSLYLSGGTNLPWGGR